jgi:hypothetical protein
LLLSEVIRAGGGGSRGQLAILSLSLTCGKQFGCSDTTYFKEEGFALAFQLI